MKVINNDYAIKKINTNIGAVYQIMLNTHGAGYIPIGLYYESFNRAKSIILTGKAKYI